MDALGVVLTVLGSLWGLASFAMLVRLLIPVRIKATGRRVIPLFFVGNDSLATHVAHATIVIAASPLSWGYLASQARKRRRAMTRTP